MRGTVEQRFWAKVDVRGPDECWPWTGRNCAGYGRLQDNFKTVQTTHIALTLAGRPRPDGKIALHSCDNPPCCNERHLRWGTQAENVADRDARQRGRWYAGDENPSRTRPECRPRGARFPQSKLTDDAVREIRASKETGKALARLFDVGTSTICRVRKGTHWSHVQ